MAYSKTLKVYAGMCSIGSASYFLAGVAGLKVHRRKPLWEIMSVTLSVLNLCLFYMTLLVFGIVGFHKDRNSKYSEWLMFCHGTNVVMSIIGFLAAMAQITLDDGSRRKLTFLWRRKEVTTTEVDMDDELQSQKRLIGGSPDENDKVVCKGRSGWAKNKCTDELIDSAPTTPEQVGIKLKEEEERAFSIPGVMMEEQNSKITTVNIDIKRQMQKHDMKTVAGAKVSADRMAKDHKDKKENGNQHGPKHDMTDVVQAKMEANKTGSAAEENKQDMSSVVQAKVDANKKGNEQSAIQRKASKQDMSTVVQTKVEANKNVNSNGMQVTENKQNMSLVVQAKVEANKTTKDQTVTQVNANKQVITTMVQGNVETNKNVSDRRSVNEKNSKTVEANDTAKPDIPSVVQAANERKSKKEQSNQNTVATADKGKGGLLAIEAKKETHSPSHSTVVVQGTETVITENIPMKAIEPNKDPKVFKQGSKESKRDHKSPKQDAKGLVALPKMKDGKVHPINDEQEERMNQQNQSKGTVSLLPQSQSKDVAKATEVGRHPTPNIPRELKPHEMNPHPEQKVSIQASRRTETHQSKANDFPLMFPLESKTDDKSQPKCPGFDKPLNSSAIIESVIDMFDQASKLPAMNAPQPPKRRTPEQQHRSKTQSQRSSEQLQKGHSESSAGIPATELEKMNAQRPRPRRGLSESSAETSPSPTGASGDTDRRKLISTTERTCVSYSTKAHIPMVHTSSVGDVPISSPETDRANGFQEPTRRGLKRDKFSMDLPRRVPPFARKRCNSADGTMPLALRDLSQPAAIITVDNDGIKQLLELKKHFAQRYY
jgi:hypothetical protein